LEIETRPRRLRNIYPEVLRRLENQESVALATILEAEGATPQVPGASALFGEKGLLSGTLGGGVLEAEAEKKALVCLKTGMSICYRFDLQGEDMSGAEPICGGFVRILLDGSPGNGKEAWRRLTDSLLSRRSGVLVTGVSQTGEERVGVERFWVDDIAAGSDAWTVSLRFRKEIEEVRDRREPVLLREEATSPEGRPNLIFLEPVVPSPRLLIVGAGHVGQALARQGLWLDFDVTVIDDRTEFASPERFPEGVHLIVADIERAVREFPVSGDTYIVIVTHGHKHDAEALKGCIRSPAAYIGMIGSQKKVALMRRRFLEAGWASSEEWDRVHAPIGLKIGSKTVEEIAVSIAAELVLVRSGSREAKAGVSE